MIIARRAGAFAALVVCLLLVAPAVVGRAEAADGLAVSKVATTHYPDVELTVDVPPGTPALAPDDVQVTERGTPVDASVSRLVGADSEVVLAIDASDAMGADALGRATAAAKQFIARMPAAARVGLVGFGGDVRVLARPTADRDAVIGLLEQLQSGGATRLYDAVLAARRAFTAAANSRLLVILSAGGDTGSTATIADASSAAQGLRIEVVSLETPVTSVLALARLAIDGHGDVATARGAVELGLVFGRLGDALLGRYKISYRSSSHGTVSVRVATPTGSVELQLDLPAAEPASASEPAPIAEPSTAASPATVPVPDTSTASAPPTLVTASVAPLPAGTLAPAGPKPASGTHRVLLLAMAVAAAVVGVVLFVRTTVPARNEARRRATTGVRSVVNDLDRWRGPAEQRADEQRAGEVEPRLDRADEPYDYDRFSVLAGPLVEVDDGEHYRVAFRSPLSRRHHAVVVPCLVLNMIAATGFYLWLIQPSHLPKPVDHGLVGAVLAYVMLAGIVVIEGMRLVSSLALSRWAGRAQDPVPVCPARGLRVAFTTTIVPSKEPLAVVRRTLEAAKQVRHDGAFDVWILDEGNDLDVRAMCRELGVRHFTRHGIAKWNRPAGRYKACTKHGNHNAWLAAHGRRYDIEISVDPDHVPLPNICERLLGYFRDPDVAFVCGPQVYGNYHGFLTRAAESQAYLFQSVIQRAANRDTCGMFVGTNHAYRIAAWKQIGGFQDSITEDMATSFAVHGATNPDTGNAWKSVYTPDVIAVGEGPATWTDFFSQQLRWARGTDEVLVRGGIRRFRRLSWSRRLHYALLCSYYPFVAMGWLLGLLLSAVYVVTGSTGLHLTDLRAWFTLYADLAVIQTSLYFWLRRLNVSPHEPEGSAGVAGMFLSMLATPVYVTAFVGSVLRRPLSFVVTPKGERVTTDGLPAFRVHLRWAVASMLVVAAAFVSGRALWAALLAPSICLLVSLTPLALWLGGRSPWRRDVVPVVSPLRPEVEMLTEVTA